VVAQAGRLKSPRTLSSYAAVPSDVKTPELAVVTQVEIVGSPSAASISGAIPSIDQTALATVSPGALLALRDP
jgi:hypothetical protein